MELARRRFAGTVPLALALAAAVGAGGCRDSARRGDSAVVAETSRPAIVETTRDTSSAMLVRRARTLYEYGPERRPIAITDSAFAGPVVPDTTAVPRMTISTATLKPGVTPPPERILARIRSSGDFAPMGIHAGDNYIARSSSDSTSAAQSVTMVVSANLAASPYRLHRDARAIEYTHGDPREPRLVRITVHSFAIAACLSDPVCSSGHCGYW
jgi:hypothetical protein